MNIGVDLLRSILSGYEKGRPDAPCLLPASPLTLPLRGPPSPRKRGEGRVRSWPPGQVMRLENCTVVARAR